MADRRYDSADRARMAALVESNGELQSRSEHLEFELQVARTRLESLVEENDRREGERAKERGKWVHDRIGLEAMLEEKAARIDSLIEAYKDISRLIEQTRGQTALRPLMRERGWLIHALERLAGMELEWDAAGVAWLEVFGHRIAVTRKEYDAAEPADLAAEVEDLALDTARCPKGHLVNFRTGRGFPGGVKGTPAWMFCPVCGEKVENPTPSPQEIRDAFTGLPKSEYRPVERQRVERKRRLGRGQGPQFDTGAQA